MASNEHSPIRAFANREIRRVPSGWQHPIDRDGNAIGVQRHGMPEVGNDAMLVAYETTSEGTPISPAFPDTPEGRLDLVRYCAEHCTTFGEHRADAEAWAVVLFGEDVTVSGDGVVEAS